MKTARASKISPKKSASKGASKASKAKSAPKGAKSKPVKKAAAPAKIKAGTHLKAVKVDKASLKREEFRKSALAKPLEVFLSHWKSKAESFEDAIVRLSAEAQFSEKDRESFIDKVISGMRKQSLPAFIEELLAERFPKDRIHKLASILSMRPKTSIRLNVMRGDVNLFGQTQLARDLKMKRGTLSPWAFEVGKADEAATHDIFKGTFERGLFDIQDEFSQLVALMVNAKPGQRILDISSGAGEKALALGAMMKNKGSLFVYDADPRKAKIFKERAARLGIDSYRILTDTQIAEVKSLDAVLVDAPSSSLGALAHHPELKWKLHKEELPRIQKLQSALLREGARKLKLGGHLIYSTTTLSKSENEAQIEHFLKTTHNSYRLVPVSSYLKDYVLPFAENFFQFTWDPKLLASLLESDPFLIASPDVHGTVGGFVAIIQRIRIST